MWGGRRGLEYLIDIAFMSSLWDDTSCAVPFPGLPLKSVSANCHKILNSISGKFRVLEKNTFSPSINPLNKSLNQPPFAKGVVIFYAGCRGGVYVWGV